MLEKVAKIFLKLGFENRPRILLAFGAVIAIILARRIPMPGLDTSQLHRFSTSPLFSLFATSQSDWDFVFILGALGCLVLKVWGGSKFQGPPAPFNRWIIVSVLIVSMFHGFQLSQILRYRTAIVDQSFDFERTALVTVTVTAGTAIYIFLGKLIWPASMSLGFWVLATINLLRLWFNKLSLLPALFGNNGTSTSLLEVALLGYIAIAAILVWVFTLRYKNNAQLSSSSLMPWLIAPPMATFLLQMVTYFNVPILAEYISYNHGFMFNRLNLLLVAILAWVYFADDRSSAVRIFSVAGFVVAGGVQILLLRYNLLAAEMRILILVITAFAAVSIFHELKIRSITILPKIRGRSRGLN